MFFLWIPLFLSWTTSGRSELPCANNRTSVTQTGNICCNNRCADLSYSQILHRYHGLFYTRDDIDDMIQTLNQLQSNQPPDNNQTLARRKKRQSDYLNSDLDKCCATFSTALLLNNLPNIFGEPRFIIHLLDRFPPMFQFIPQGQCVFGYGECTDCKQMQRLQPLLVVDLDHEPPRAIFDLFYIDTYCSCNEL